MLNTNDCRSAGEQPLGPTSAREHNAAAVLKGATGDVTVQLSSGATITGTLVDADSINLHRNQPSGFVRITDGDGTEWVLFLNEILAIGQAQ